MSLMVRHLHKEYTVANKKNTHQDVKMILGIKSSYYTVNNLVTKDNMPSNILSFSSQRIACVTHV
jgi:hypothetical protein